MKMYETQIVASTPVSNLIIARVVITTNGVFYQDELKKSILKMMKKHYLNVKVKKNNVTLKRGVSK